MRCRHVRIIHHLTITPRRPVGSRSHPPPQSPGSRTRRWLRNGTADPARLRLRRRPDPRRHSLRHVHRQLFHAPTRQHHPPSPPGSLWIGELVVVIARRPSGHRVAYPGLETVNADRRHLGPSKSTPTPPLTAERAAATAIAIAIADGIDATGIIAVEFLLAFDGRPFVNNILLGPHPHRDPAIDPAITSQYENHLRAILDWPLGATTIGTPTP